MILLPLPIPKACPTGSSATHCIDLPESTCAGGNKIAHPSNDAVAQDGMLMQTVEAVSPGSDGNKKRKASKRPAPVVDSQVRRSERVKQGSNGFKNSSCSSKKCTSCNPPTLSNKVIRNLGVQFCSLDPEALEDENLIKGGGQKEPVAKKKSKIAKANKDTKKNAVDGSEGDGSAPVGP